MTAAEIATLVPAIAALLTAVAGYLKAHTTSQKLNNHLNGKP